ncbi:hypothetical protein, partial [Nocardia brasiliensis]|uniref:hypothetical protein n=1 Tax=Nocardia brasiliensis TaxID=37326 RepID=UPI0024549CFE
MVGSSEAAIIARMDLAGLLPSCCTSPGTATQGQVLAERLALRLAPLLGKDAAKKVLQVAAFEAQQSGRSF